MITFTRSLLGLAVAAALSGCGGSGSDPEQQTSTTVSGVAIKGQLSDAVVVGSKYVNGQKVEVARTTTDATGAYSFEVTDYTGPLIVEISASTDSENPTKMFCDAVGGCGSAAFGDEINVTALDPNFELNAIAVVDPTAKTAQKINVTSVTHLAAAVIEQHRVDEPSNFNTTLITKTLSEVANSLKIIGDINELEPTNVNDINAVATEDNANELNYGLVNSAIAQQLFNGATDDEPLSDKLAAAAQDLIDNDGEFLGENDNDDSSFELNIVDILNDIKSLVTLLDQEITADQNSDNPTITAEATAGITEALAIIDSNLDHTITETTANINDDGRIDTVSDAVTEGGPIEVAAGLVEDLRLLVNLFDTETVAGTDVNTGVEAYNALLNDAAIMLQAESDSFTLLSEVGTAIAKIELLQQEEDATDITYNLTDLRAAESNLTGTVTYDPDNYNFIINATDGNQSAQLNATAGISADKLSVEITLSGTVESAGATLTLANTSGVTVDFGQTITTEILESDDDSIEPIAGQLTLDVTLSQKATSELTDPMSFTGKINADLVTVLTPEVRQEYWNWDGRSNTVYVEIEPILLPELLSLSGELTSSDTVASVILSVALPDVATYQAAGLETVGKKVPQNYTVVVSSDGNTVTETVTDGFSGTLEYTAGTDGSSSYTYNRTADNADNSSYGATFKSSHYISQKTLAAGVEYFLAGEFEDNEGKGGYNITITPMVDDQTGQVLYYQVLKSTVQHSTEQPADDNVLNPDTHELINYQDSYVETEERFFDSMADYLDSSFARYDVAPDQLTSALAVYQTMMSTTGGSRDYVKDVGEVLTLNSANVEALSNGDTLTLDSYVTAPLIKEAVELAVTNSGNLISLSISDQLFTQWTYESTGDDAGNYELNKQVLYSTFDYYEESYQITSATTAVDGTEQLELSATYQDNSSYEMTTYSPTDIGYQICVKYDMTQESSQNCHLVDAVTLAAAIASDTNNDFDLLNINSALDFVTRDLSAGNSAADEIDVTFSAWIDDTGLLKHQLTSAEYTAITELDESADSTTLYDALLLEAVNNESGLESESHYLQANANLTLKTVLGDYEITLGVASNRTDFEEGDFNLTVTYQLPSEDTQRSFAIAADSTVDDQLIITNAEGVSMTLVKMNEAVSEGETLIGVINVDDEQVAKIVDREGTVLIIYKNGVVESI